MIEKIKISADYALNEAPSYGSAFSRAIEVPMGDFSFVLISGTASVDENGKTYMPGSFNDQVARTFHNISCLLSEAGVNWHDVVRTRCYLRDMDRDYKSFNDYRTHFYKINKINPYPASLCIEARLCRPDLLVEIEATAIKEGR